MFDVVVMISECLQAEKLVAAERNPSAHICDFVPQWGNRFIRKMSDSSDVDLLRPRKIEKVCSQFE